MNDKQINAAAQQLIGHPENHEAIIIPIARDVLTDVNVNDPNAVFKSRLRRIENVLRAEGVSRELINSFFSESLAVFDRTMRKASNPAPTKRYTDDTFVPRLNGARK